LHLTFLGFTELGLYFLLGFSPSLKAAAFVEVIKQSFLLYYVFYFVPAAVFCALCTMAPNMACNNNHRCYKCTCDNPAPAHALVHQNQRQYLAMDACRRVFTPVFHLLQLLFGHVYEAGSLAILVAFTRHMLLPLQLLGAPHQ
jgi:hypothetical protein